MRVRKSDYVMGWEVEKKEQATKLAAKGQRVYEWDLATHEEMGTPIDFATTYPIIYGQACGGITDVKAAKDIVDELVAGTVAAVQRLHGLLARL